MLYIPESRKGVCLWEVEDESGEWGLLAIEPGVVLSMDGFVGDKRVEAEVEKAARYWLGAGPTDIIGRPKWIHGARKVTQGEWEDQMERLQDGKIPDWVDEARQIALKGKNKNA